MCQEQDGKVYPLAEAVVGINYPPLHPWCRSTTIPYFEDLGGERIAKDADGTRYYVPGDMTYEEWKKRAEAGERVSIPQVEAVIERSPFLAVVPDGYEQEFVSKLYSFLTNIDKEKVLHDLTLRKRLIEDSSLALPLAEKAYAEDRKFTHYFYSKTNKSGAAKGVAFASHLGYTIDNWEILRDEILKNAKFFPIVSSDEREYGIFYEQEIVLYGITRRPMKVLVVWEQKIGDVGPRLVTAFPN